MIRMNEMKKVTWILWTLMIGTWCLFPLRAHGNPPTLPQRVIERQEVIEILETTLQRAINDRRKRVEVKEVRGCENVMIPSGSFSYEVILPEEAYRGGNISAAILFYVDGKEVKKIRVSGQVDIYADVVVARSYLEKHRVIYDKDIQWVNKNISSFPPDIVTEFEEVVGKRTNLTVNSQEVLRKSMVERPPLVKKGDRITLVIENNQFKITDLAEVQEEGGKGDRVRLINLSSKREVYGRVLDANTALVNF